MVESIEFSISNGGWYPKTLVWIGTRKFFSTNGAGKTGQLGAKIKESKSDPFITLTLCTKVESKCYKHLNIKSEFLNYIMVLND